LNSQSIAQPKHWRDEAESSTQAWLVGQAVALRETSWRLSLNPAGNAQTQAAWQGLVWLLAEVTAAETTLLRIDAVTADAADQPFARTQQQADALARRAAAQNFNDEFARRLLRHLAELDTAFLQPADSSREVLFCRAQRLVLALEHLASARLTTTAHSPSSPELATLRQDLDSAGTFDPAQFARHLASFRATLD